MERVLKHRKGVTSPNSHYSVVQVEGTEVETRGIRKGWRLHSSRYQKECVEREKVYCGVGGPGPQ